MITRSKARFPVRQRGKRYPRQAWRTDYQYAQGTQKMGPGTTVKNFERTIEVTAKTNVVFELTAFADDDFNSCCMHYRYVKIQGVLITQNSINLTNEQDSVYTRVSWSNSFEEEEDINKDDASKILPNIGRKRFLFVPPNAQVSYYRNSSTITINLNNFVSTEHLLQADDSYKIPGHMQVYNDTNTARKLRVIIRVLFRGSKVIDKVEEAKRILRLNNLWTDGLEDEKKKESTVKQATEAFAAEENIG